MNVIEIIILSVAAIGGVLIVIGNIMRKKK